MVVIISIIFTNVFLGLIGETFETWRGIRLIPTTIFRWLPGFVSFLQAIRRTACSMQVPVKCVLHYDSKTYGMNERDE